jgi:nicotinamide-nucleotide amidase
MATNVRKKMNANFGIGITGIAGPSGGSPKKPVGTVWIAVASGKKTVSKRFIFGSDRERNIRKSALSALNMLRIMLDNPVD